VSLLALPAGKEHNPIQIDVRKVYTGSNRCPWRRREVLSIEKFKTVDTQTRIDSKTISSTTAKAPDLIQRKLTPFIDK
jgi:hypothetical protein